MSPFQTFRVIGCAILIAIVLTVVLFPWLEAGHASPVIFLVPGCLCRTCSAVRGCGNCGTIGAPGSSLP